MAGSPNRISRFWKELKRRRVAHVIAVYASAAFVIIELVNNLTEPLNLPPSLATIVIILLAAGFPLAVILGWIYDLTPEGIERTGPVEPTDQGRPVAVPNAWKIATYASFLVIAGLVVLNVLRGPARIHRGDIRSLVLLPLENYTGDDQMGNLVAGMHSLLIGDMGRISGLRVIGKTSSNAYGGKDMTARDIARELNVDAVVEGGVIFVGDTVCMQLRLINARGEERQLWVGDFREDKGQFLNMLNRVTRQITSEIMVELTEQEEQILAKDRSADREAMDAYIRSHQYWGDLGREALDNAEKHLMRAIEKDPDWATLYSAMAIVWGGKMQMGMVDPETGRNKMYEYLNRANELDPGFIDAHFIMAVIATWTDWNWEKGEKEFLKSLAVNPSHVMSRIYYSHLLMILQRMDEALVQAKLAVDLDPENPLVLALYSTILKGDGQHGPVLEYLEKALSIDPEHSFTRVQLERAFYNLGEYEKSLELQQGYLVRVLEEDSLPDLVSLYREQGRLAAYREVLRLKEIRHRDDNYRPISLSRDYYRAEVYDRALDELEKGLAVRDPNMPYIGTGTRYAALHDSARFLAILDSMHLPHPGVK